jgi:hypothetical protein
VRREEAAWPAIVQVCSHSRQRQTDVTEITLAKVPMILPLQNGQAVGRDTASAGRESYIVGAVSPAVGQMCGAPCGRLLSIVREIGRGICLFVNSHAS